MKPYWTRQETAAARRMRGLDVPYAVIGTIFDRSPHAVKRHLQYRSEQSA